MKTERATSFPSKIFGAARALENECGGWEAANEWNRIHFYQQRLIIHRGRRWSRDRKQLVIRRERDRNAELIFVLSILIEQPALTWANVNSRDFSDHLKAVPVAMTCVDRREEGWREHGFACIQVQRKCFGDVKSGASGKIDRFSSKGFPGIYRNANSCRYVIHHEWLITLWRHDDTVIFRSRLFELTRKINLWVETFSRYIKFDA